MLSSCACTNEQNIGPLGDTNLDKWLSGGGSRPLVLPADERERRGTPRSCPIHAHSQARYLTSLRDPIRGSGEESLQHDRRHVPFLQTVPPYFWRWNERRADLEGEFDVLEERNVSWIPSVEGGADVHAEGLCGGYGVARDLQAA